MFYFSLSLKRIVKCHSNLGRFMTSTALRIFLSFALLFCLLHNCCQFHLDFYAACFFCGSFPYLLCNCQPSWLHTTMPLPSPSVSRTTMSTPLSTPTLLWPWPKVANFFFFYQKWKKRIQKTFFYLLLGMYCLLKPGKILTNSFRLYLFTCNRGV